MLAEPGALGDAWHTFSQPTDGFPIASGPLTIVSLRKVAAVAESSAPVSRFGTGLTWHRSRSWLGVASKLQKKVLDTRWRLKQDHQRVRGPMVLSVTSEPGMQFLPVTPGRRQRLLSLSRRTRANPSGELRLIQVLFSTAGGGGPPSANCNTARAE